MFIPVTNPSLVAHWPLAVAAVDVQRCRRLVQAGDGAARTQLDDLIGHVPQLESLQQVYVGHVPVLLKWKQLIQGFLFCLLFQTAILQLKFKAFSSVQVSDLQLTVRHTA